jgi:Holliday junction resolvase
MPNPYASALGKTPRKGEEKKRLSPSHKRAPKQERETALRLKGVLTPASGAKDVKGDVRVKRMVRIECKTTKHSSFSVTLDMVRKLEEAALATGEMPAFLIEFNNNGKKVAELAVVPAYVLESLCLTPDE